LNLPDVLLDALEGIPGFDRQAFLSAHESSPLASVRFNPRKPVLPDLDLKSNIPWCSQGFYLNARPVFTLDPLFHAGTYYVQEASSMFLEQALKQCVDLQQDIRVLDLCAAPGGKSTHIQSLLSDESLLVSNEVSKQRLGVLEENIIKWGATNVIVASAEAQKWARLKDFFDVIVADVPCSGSGLFRKVPMALNEWSTANVQFCSVRQQSIIHDLLPALKPGGVLIYSTCSYSREENELMCDFIMQNNMQPLSVQLQADWNIVESTTTTGATGYRFYPYNLHGEGFFMSVFQKPNEETFVKYKPSVVKQVPAHVLKVAQTFMHLDEKVMIPHSDNYLLMNRAVADWLPLIQEHAYIRKAGMSAGKIGKGQWIPEHDLAMSLSLNHEVPVHDLSKEEALEYLRGNSVEIPHTGWYLVQYKQVSLGWVKAMSNRVNNYYPKHFRIQHL
jgi:16S rRNA C967 or C1407 C5-methylase (RsmB/RsmF family)/NOL1/NOP2/fmu family ribosome biogenesis protein